MSQFYEVIDALSEEIKLGLPGWEAQKRMVAPGRDLLDISKIEKNNPRKSSVLIWLYPKENEVFTRLILRTQIGKVHGGQVAFPGGKYEVTDEDLWHTALREAQEEIGLVPQKINKVGELTTVYIPPSNFWVHPFIGSSENEMPPVIEPAEVVRTIDMNILALLDPHIKEEKIICRSSIDAEAQTPYYNIQGYTVWGATAMILSELEILLGRTYQKIK